MKVFTRTLAGALVCLLLLAGCGQKKVESALWENATYTEDTALGEGEKELKVVVEADTHKVTFTLSTDANTVGEALLEHKLIAGEESEFGLYVKEVNGIRADFDTDQAYWAFLKGGEMQMMGVDGAEFASGDQFELVYTKG